MLYACVETACVLSAGIGSLHETSQHAHRNCYTYNIETLSHNQGHVKYVM